MGNHSFDDLLQGLQSTLLAAQDTLSKRCEEAVRRICVMSETGELQTPVFSFAIPRIGTNEDEYEVLSLSASSFRAHHRHQISMLSVEFECEFKEDTLTGDSRVYSFEIKDYKKRWWWRKKQSRMQIVFSGTDQFSGEVTIDGKFLMEIPCYDGVVDRPPLTGTKRPLLLRLMDLLQNLWRSQKFVMTVEQSRRVRETLSN